MSRPARVGPTERPCGDGQKRHPIERCVVRVRCGNYSAFNGYHFTWSDYSEVECLDCGTHWRTKARYVDRLADA